jgi:Acyl-CoA synthetases (AMP-forming)/AMP-acid ligases II
MLPNLNDAPIEDRLAFVISAVAKEFPDRVAIVNNAGTELRYEVTYASLASMLERLEQSLDEHRPVGVIARGNRLESLIAIAAACGRQHIPLAFLAEDARDLVGQLRDWMTLDDILELAKSSE